IGFLGTVCLPATGSFGCSKRGTACVNLAIYFDVAQNCLHVIAGLGKRNRFDELIDPAVRTRSLPVFYPAVSSVVGGQRILRDSAKFVESLFEEASAQSNVGFRIK